MNWMSYHACLETIAKHELGVDELPQDVKDDIDWRVWDAAEKVWEVHRRCHNCGAVVLRSEPKCARCDYEHC